MELKLFFPRWLWCIQWNGGRMYLHGIKIAPVVSDLCIITE